MSKYRIVIEVSEQSLAKQFYDSEGASTDDFLAETIEELDWYKSLSCDGNMAYGFSFDKISFEKVED